MAHIIWIDDGTSYKRAKVVYEVKTLNGQRKRKSKTFPAKTKKAVIDAFIRQVETTYAKSDGVLYEACTVSQFADIYWELYQDSLSASTQRSYQSSINSSPWGIKANLGNIDIKKLKLEHVQRYCNDMANAGLGAKTIKNRIMLVHSLWDRARKMQYVERDAYNPTCDVEFPKKKAKKYQAYDQDEVKLMLKLAKEYGNPFLELQIYLGVYTGMRRSEQAALLWSDIDFENQVIHVNKAKVRGLDGDRIKETKTEAGERDIPIASALMVVLKAHKLNYNKNKMKYGKKFNDSQFLFADEYGNPYIVNSISHRWQRFQDFAEPKGLRKVPYHYLRHAYASLLLASNQVDIKTAQSLMGHSSITMTADIYADAYMKNKKEAVQVLDELLKAQA